MTDTEEPDWLLERRKLAAGRYAVLDMPTTRSPGWEFTDLKGFDPESYAPSVGGDAGALKRMRPLVAPIEGALRIDQVDASTLSTTEPDGAPSAHDEADHPKKPVVMPLELAAKRYPDLVSSRLGTVVASDDPFVSANDAHWRGGAFIYLPSGTTLESPVQISCIQDSPDASTFWRTLIVLEDNSEAEVWEQYLSSNDDVEGLFNSVVELYIGSGARLRYVCGQGLSEKSWVFGTQRAEVDSDGSLDWVALGFGSAKGKVRMETKLAGRGSSARVTGAYAGHANQHLDFDTTQEHAAENTTSDLAFRGILEDESTAVWRGMIEVDPVAQQTDAFQENRNLLLSKDAHADAIPGLEIEANEVRCTHAAAVSQIDKKQVYYLMAHGLKKDVATRMIIDGFMLALVVRLDEGPIHDAVAGALERRLAAILDR